MSGTEKVESTGIHKKCLSCQRKQRSSIRLESTMYFEISSFRTHEKRKENEQLPLVTYPRYCVCFVILRHFSIYSVDYCIENQYQLRVLISFKKP